MPHSLTRRWPTLVAAFGLAAALWSTGAQAESPPPRALPALHIQGGQWVRTDGQGVALRGTNLGNWLIQEFWMMGQSTKAIDDQCTLEATLDRRFGRVERERLMKLFHDQWITERDWDWMPKFGLNLVRLPFLWSLLEDEQHPGQLRTDAWHYLDWAIAQAEARGMYVILDLHGAVGSQGLEHHSGCADRNQYWSTPEFQARTAWLWQQIAQRYRHRAAVAAYGLLNEPWGTTPEGLAAVMKPLYQAIRTVDPDKIIVLPGHNSGIGAYGHPAREGYAQVAFEMHFYPGHFGWQKPGREVHRDWLTCRPAGQGVCEWQTRLKALDAAFFVGEFQPWADLDDELGAQLTRATYDTYAQLGWASAAWSFKMLSNEGGLLPKVWGLVTNAKGEALPALDFATAPLPDIEALFRRFGTVPYQPRTAILHWMNSPQAPQPFR